MGEQSMQNAQVENASVVATAETPLLKSVIETTERGLSLRTIDDIWRYASILVKANMVPKDFLGSVEKTFTAITFGAELGLSPWMALNSVAMIEGRPRLWGDAVLGLCIKSGLFDHGKFTCRIEGDGKARKAICTVRRKPDGNVVTKEFSMADAERAGLLTKQDGTLRNTPWKTYPDIMLAARAKTFALREAFADVLSGIPCVEDAEAAREGGTLEEAGLEPRTLDVLADQLEQSLKSTPAPAPQPAKINDEEKHTAAKGRIKDKAAALALEPAVVPAGAGELFGS